MSLWWCSWYSGEDDYRPRTYPPNHGVLGYWVTGFCDEERVAILCAMVQADSEEHARHTIAIDWPESADGEWRFVEEQERPSLSNRFPLSDWMRERFAGLE